MINRTAKTTITSGFERTKVNKKDPIKPVREVGMGNEKR